MIGNARISRSQLRGFLQPLFRRRQIALLEVSVAQIVGSVGKWWLGGCLGQISDCAGVLLIVQVKPSQVVEDVGMISDFAAHDFKLATGLIGFVQFEERDRQGKSRPQTQRWDRLQRSSKFG